MEIRAVTKIMLQSMQDYKLQNFLGEGTIQYLRIINRMTVI